MLAFDGGGKVYKGSGEERLSWGERLANFEVVFAVQVGGFDVADALIVSGGEQHNVSGDVVVTLDLDDVANFDVLWGGVGNDMAMRMVATVLVKIQMLPLFLTTLLMT